MGTREVGNPDDRLNQQHAILLTGEAGLSERFSLQGSLPLRSFDITGREEVSGKGAGDLELTLRQSLTDQEEETSRFSAVAFYGAALPTGKDSDLSLLQQNAQFSRGVFSGIMGGEAALRLGEASRLYGRVEGQFPIGNDDDYRFSPTRQATAVFSSALGGSTVSWLGGLEFRYAGRDEAKCLEADPRTECDTSGGGQPVHRSFFNVDNRGGHQTRLVGGLLLAVTRRHNVGILAGYLLDADLHGDQLVARTEYVVGWQGTFGTHRHGTQ